MVFFLGRKVFWLCCPRGHTSCSGWTCGRESENTEKTEKRILRKLYGDATGKKSR